MKRNTSTILLGMSVAIVAGLLGSTTFGVLGTSPAPQADVNTSALISGHVVTTLTDSEGNIKAYRQSDNLIVNQGENCVLKMLFATTGGAASGNTVCTGANTSGFRYISIGNSTDTVNSADYKLHNPYNATGGVSSLARKFSSVSTTGWTNSTGSGAGTTASVVMTATFTNGQTGSQTVSESGLFNDTETNANTDAMFARQTFTGITMNSGDSLTVQWTISVGGTGSALTP